MPVVLPRVIDVHKSGESKMLDFIWGGWRFL